MENSCRKFMQKIQAENSCRSRNKGPFLPFSKQKNIRPGANGFKGHQVTNFENKFSDYECVLNPGYQETTCD